MIQEVFSLRVAAQPVYFDMMYFDISGFVLVDSLR
jgi:hypothetical protein